MLRQRIRARTSPLAAIGWVVLVLFAVALVWYGLMLLLLALKVPPGTVDTISGHRTAFDFLAGLTPRDIGSETRLIAGIAGLVAFLLFAFAALKMLPRPHFTRGPMSLADDEIGTIEMRPRAVERIAEIAAREDPAVSAAAGRLGNEELTVNLHVSRAREVPEAMHEAQRHVREALERHGVPAGTVNVTLTGFDRATRRELS
ncbi:MAG: Asp23/Gls24 family envelope stress response protein [Thermoleophilaceae bacterium]|nr:Asp23/Gls24 family envelope stress response protein [Thermoleophilaceae bacterium]